MSAVERGECTVAEESKRKYAELEKMFVTALKAANEAPRASRKDGKIHRRSENRSKRRNFGFNEHERAKYSRYQRFG